MSVPNRSLKFVSFLDRKADGWFDDLEKLVNSFADRDLPCNVFIEDPQFLLYLTETSDSSLLSKFSKLNRLANLYLIMPTDRSLLDYSELSNDLSTVYSTLLLKLIHKAHLMLKLRPLRTGRADDITGELVVIKGPIDDPGLSIRERDYLYLLNKDGNVKLFYR
ncbi:hypothetical protein FOA43_001598 [Brettanomyces nanus]|uniref:Uncharacterized protein n=1 Tax=Eeniella nana TaxID=13502 RepID=A0A875S032_EENNA|nr:uncharacterized protein FOA43_001598 [Brettanomyces nanus]QPG74273.1 hypothetical protein FOA43_001598 [Brettanomyces nanus]